MRAWSGRTLDYERPSIVAKAALVLEVGEPETYTFSVVPALTQTSAVKLQA